MRCARTLLVALAIAVCGLALCTSAPGFFAGKGSGESPVTLGKLTVPAITAATSDAGTVALTWEPSSGPSGAIAYYVTRDGTSADGDCPPATEPVAKVTSCTDEDLEPGTYAYKVTAVWKSWSATSEATAAKVTAGPNDHFVLEPASTTPSAGAADNLTITLEDHKGATVTSYTGEHALTFEGAEAIGTNKPTVSNSGGTAVAFGNATKIKFTAGVATVSGTKNGAMKLYKAGPTTISVTDGTIESEGESEPTVTVAPLAMKSLRLSAETTTPVAGAEDALTVTANDTYGNVATAYTGSHSLKYSGPAAAPDGTAPTVTDKSGEEVGIGTATPTEFNEGVATAAEGANGVLRLYKAAAANVKVAEGSVSSATVSITASAAPAAVLTMTATSKTPAAGATDNLKLTALDPYGNTATAYAGARSLTFEGPEPSPSGTEATVVDTEGNAVAIGSPTSLTFTAGVSSVSASKNGVLKTARSGATTLTATDGTISTEAVVQLTVAAGTAAKFAWAAPTISAGTLGSPCLFTCTVTKLGNGGTFTAKVAVTDALGNVVSNLGNGHSATVTATAGSTVTGGSLTIPKSGLAESETTFTYKSKASGAFTDTITVAKAAGTAYAGATATTSR